MRAQIFVRSCPLLLSHAHTTHLRNQLGDDTMDQEMCISIEMSEKVSIDNLESILQYKKNLNCTINASLEYNI